MPKVSLAHAAVSAYFVKGPNFWSLFLSLLLYFYTEQSCSKLQKQPGNPDCLARSGALQSVASGHDFSPSHHMNLELLAKQ